MTILNMWQVRAMQRRYVTLRIQPYLNPRYEAECRLSMIERLREDLRFPARAEDIHFIQEDTFGNWGLLARWEPANKEVELIGGLLGGLVAEIPVGLDKLETMVPRPPVHWQSETGSRKPGRPPLAAETVIYDMVGFNGETHRRVFRLSTPTPSLLKQPVSNQ